MQIMYKALKQLLLIDWAHRHTPKINDGRGLYSALQLGREGELRTRACTCTCPPCAVCSSLSGCGTRTHRLNAASGTRDRTTDASQHEGGRGGRRRGDRHSRPEKLPRIRRHQARPTQTARQNAPITIPLPRWEGFLPWPLASRLDGCVARFAGRPSLDRPTEGGATPTLLGGVPI